MGSVDQLSLASYRMERSAVLNLQHDEFRIYDPWQPIHHRPQGLQFAHGLRGSARAALGRITAI